MSLLKDGKNLVWMDLEMTGLDAERDTIIEMATIISDAFLEILVEGPTFAIHQPEEVLVRMDPWCVEHHGASGLTQRVRDSKVTMAEAEAATLEFIGRYVPDRSSPLCGSSIHQDRRFLLRYMPRLNDYLHYRIVDVSSIKELVSRWYPYDRRPPTKSKEHLAHGDVLASIDELRFYRQTYFK